MAETQTTIGTWADDTFPGAYPFTPRQAIRLLEEVAEFCKAAGCTQSEVIAGTEKAYAGMRLKQADPEPPEKVAKELADGYIVMAVIAHRLDIDLCAYVDAKMAVNRSRRWKPNGDGTGYHIKESVA